MRIAIVTSRFPYPIEKGDKLRIYHQIKYLSQYHDIYLYSVSHDSIDEKDIDQLHQYCEKIKIYKLSKFVQGLYLVLGIFSSLPFQVLYFLNPRVRKNLQFEILNDNADVVYCQLVRCSEYVKNLNKFKVLDYMDNLSLGFLRRSQKSQNKMVRMLNKMESTRLKNYEEKIFPSFDKHVIISERDKEAFSFSSKSSIEVVPNGVDSTQFANNQKTRYNKNDKIPSEGLTSLLFVGNMGYEPNQIAVQYFIDSVWPLLDHDEFQFIIAGARPSAQLASQQSKRLIVTGWIEDIRDAYLSGNIFVAPIFSGSGQQNKILEAMAMSLPVITTSIVNISINGVHGKELIIADDVMEFRDAIEMLAADPEMRKEIGNNARKLVEKNYSWQNNTKKLREIIELYEK